MNFKEHFLFGLVIGILFSSIFLVYESLSLFLFFPLLLAILGAIFPDFDHHASIPFRILKISVFIIVTLSSFIFFVNNKILSSITESLEKFIYLAFGVFVSEKIMEIFIDLLFAVVVGIFAVIIIKAIRPAHRGILHTKKTGIFVGGILWLFFFVLTQNQGIAMLFSASFILGFFSHLALDKILFKK